MTLRRRLEKLESGAGMAAAMPPVKITLLFYEPDPEGPRLCGAMRLPGERTIDREDGEAEADFRARAEAAFAA